MHDILPSLFVALPEVLLATAALVLLMVGAFHPEGRHEESIAAYERVHLPTMLSLAAALVLVLFYGTGGEAFGGLFVADAFTRFAKVLVLSAGLITLYMGHDYIRQHRMARFEFPVLVLLATLGMLMMVSANDFMALYMGLELQSLALYVMAAFRRDETRSGEAGLKYFMLGALASGMFLYGCTLIYGFSGTTAFPIVKEVLSHNEHHTTGLIIGMVLVVAGLAFKIAAVPFHMWSPDVYEGAPTPVTAFFAVAPKIATVILLVRLMEQPLGALMHAWQQIIVFMSVASMLLGAFAAIWQRNIKRLMAYSSIGHVGYLLIGLVVGNEMGLQAVLIYLAIYMVMNVGMFAFILSMKRDGLMVEEISDLAGYSKTHPLFAIALTVFMFSMAGIPPLAGFFGKFYIFVAALEAGFYTLAIIGVLSSVVSAFYYLRLIKVAWFDAPADALDGDIATSIKVVISASALLIVLFAFYPAPVLEMAMYAARALLIVS